MSLRGKVVLVVGVGGGLGTALVSLLGADGAKVVAVGHCMSATLFDTLERAHVAVAPIRTTVRTTVGRNENGRLRVRALSVEIRTQPLKDEDRASFERCVEVFADYCTVSGAVRDGIPIDSRVTPG